MKQLLLSFSLLTEEVEKKKTLQKTGEEEEIGWILQTIDPTDKIFSTFVQHKLTVVFALVIRPVIFIICRRQIESFQRFL